MRQHSQVKLPLASATELHFFRVWGFRLSCGKDAASVGKLLHLSFSCLDRLKQGYATRLPLATEESVVCHDEDFPTFRDDAVADLHSRHGSATADNNEKCRKGKRMLCKLFTRVFTHHATSHNASNLVRLLVLTRLHRKLPQDPFRMPGSGPCPPQESAAS